MIQETKEASNSKEKTSEKTSAKVQGLAKAPKITPQTVTDINYKAALNSIDQSKKRIPSKKKENIKNEEETNKNDELTLNEKPFNVKIKQEKDSSIPKDDRIKDKPKMTELNIKSEGPITRSDPQKIDISTFNLDSNLKPIVIDATKKSSKPKKLLGKKKAIQKEDIGTVVTLDDVSVASSETELLTQPMQLATITDDFEIPKTLKDLPVDSLGKYYKVGYDMNNKPVSKCRYFCELQWNKKQLIFDMVDGKDQLDFSLHDIKSISRHYMIGGRIRYITRFANGDEGPCFNIEKCSSVLLYYRVWDYLMVDEPTTTRTLAKLTRIYEIYRFIKTFKANLTEGISLEKALKSKIASRKSKEEEERIKEVYVTYLTTEMKLFRDVHGEGGVIVKVNNVEQAFKLDEFRNFSSPEVYLKLSSKYERMKSTIPKEILSMTSVLLKYNINKPSKEYSVKHTSKVKYDVLANEDNCLLHALRLLDSSFRKRKYYNLLKNKDFPDQIKTVNGILSKTNRKLKLIGRGSSTVWIYLKNCNLTKLLIFWESGGDIHAEAVNNGKCIEAPQEHVKRMMNRGCEIREYEIVGRDGCDDEYANEDFEDLHLSDNDDEDESESKI